MTFYICFTHNSVIIIIINNQSVSLIRQSQVKLISIWIFHDVLKTLYIKKKIHRQNILHHRLVFYSIFLILYLFICRYFAITFVFVNRSLSFSLSHSQISIICEFFLNFFFVIVEIIVIHRRVRQCLFVRKRERKRYISRQVMVGCFTKKNVSLFLYCVKCVFVCVDSS